MCSVHACKQARKRLRGTHNQLHHQTERNRHAADVAPHATANGGEDEVRQSVWLDVEPAGRGLSAQ